MFVDYLLTHKDRFRKRMIDLKIEESKKSRSYKERFHHVAIAGARLTGEILEEMGWMASTSWTDSGLKQSEINRKANKAVADKVKEHQAEDDTLPPDKHFAPFLAALTSKNQDGFTQTTDYKKALWSGTQRRVLGITLTFTPGNQVGQPPGTWLLVLADYFDSYCTQQKKSDPSNLIGKWRAAGHEIHKGEFAIKELISEMAGVPDPTYYFFKTG